MSKGKTEDAKELDSQGIDVSEEDEKGLEDEQFSDKVKNLGGKSIRQIGKWNNESFLYAFDKQLISFGIRLLLFLHWVRNTCIFFGNGHMQIPHPTGG